MADEHVKEVMEICEEMMPLIGEHLNFRCPLAAEAKAGTSWAYTH